MNVLAFLGGALHLVIQPYFIVAAAGVGLAVWMALQSQIRLAVAILIVAGLVSAWLMFQGLQAQITAANAALAHANQLRAAAEAVAHINGSAIIEADHTERVNTVTRTIIEQAQREITDAAQRQDAHAMYVAWSNGIERVWNDDGAASA